MGGAGGVYNSQFWGITWNEAVRNVVDCGESLYPIGYGHQMLLDLFSPILLSNYSLCLSASSTVLLFFSAAISFSVNSFIQAMTFSSQMSWTYGNWSKNKNRNDQSLPKDDVHHIMHLLRKTFRWG